VAVRGTLTYERGTGWGIQPRPKTESVYGGEYMLTVTANGQVLNVDVQQLRMTSADEATVQSGPGNPVTIWRRNAATSDVFPPRGQRVFGHGRGRCSRRRCSFTVRPGSPTSK
jgi:hypothetical protein